MKKFAVLAVLAVAGAAFLGGCSDSGTKADGDYLVVSFQDTAPQTMKAAAVDQIKLTSARVVIGRVQFYGDSGDSLNFRTAEHSPLIVNLDLNGNQHDIGAVRITPGVFHRSLFRIERLEVADSAVYNAHPEMQGFSIRIEGYVNGNMDSTFVFTSELDEEQQRDFDTLTIVEGNSYNVVFRFDHRDWFSDGQGGLIDPNEAQLSSSRSIVEENIKNGFDVFKP